MTFIDAPGLHDTNCRSEEDIMTRIISELAILSKQSKIQGISGFILCNNLAGPRIYIQDTVTILTNHFGPELIRSSVGLLTQKDNALIMKTKEGNVVYEENKSAIRLQINILARMFSGHKLATVEWSCKSQVAGQEKALLAELAKLPVWKFKYLDEVQKQIDEEFQRLLKNPANIEMKDVDVTKTDIVTVTNQQIAQKIYLGLYTTSKVVDVKSQIPVTNTVKEKRAGLKESEGYYMLMAKKNVKDRITELIKKYSNEINDA